MFLKFLDLIYNIEWYLRRGFCFLFGCKITHHQQGWGIPEDIPGFGVCSRCYQTDDVLDSCSKEIFYEGCFELAWQWIVWKVLSIFSKKH